MDNAAQHRRRLAGANAVLATLGLLALLLMPAGTTTSLTATEAPGGLAESSLGAGPNAAPDQAEGLEGDTSAGSGGASLEGYTAAAPANGVPNALLQVQVSAPPGAIPVRSTINHPSCGVGFTKVEPATTAGFCIHTVGDPMPPLSPVTHFATKAPVCMGNGVNGPRILPVYITVEGQPNRTAAMVSRISNEFLPRMEATYRETSKAQGREIGMRLHMPACKVSVVTLVMDADNGRSDDAGVMLGRVAAKLEQSGLVKTDRKYLVWIDAKSTNACGVAGSTVPLAAHVTDNAITGNAQNLGYQATPVLPTETALTFRDCWGRGGTGARTEIHELTHSLGAVGRAAPNSNGFGHCVDDLDIMCYGEQGVLTQPRCAVVVELLDCGADDYFNVRPNAGSYLSTHWNTANSRFLGDAVVDNVPVELPRP